MPPTQIMPIIFMVLLLAVLAYLLYRGPSEPREGVRKSSLARDGGQGGNWYLLPADQRAAVVEERKRAGKR